MARKRFNTDEKSLLTPGATVEWRNGSHWHPGVIVTGEIVTRDTGWQSVLVTNHATTRTVQRPDRHGHPRPRTPEREHRLTPERKEPPMNTPSPKTNEQPVNDTIRVHAHLIIEVSREAWDVNYGNETTRQITSHVRATALAAVQENPAVQSWEAEVTLKR